MFEDKLQTPAGKGRRVLGPGLVISAQALTVSGQTVLLPDGNKRQ
jgi:hypothetical protein